MLLIHRETVTHLSELENNSKSVWVKVFANKASHYVASWYRPTGGSSEDYQLFRDQLDQTRSKQKGNKLPSVHVLGDFNFKDIAWPDRLNKSGSMLSQSEGPILIDIMTLKLPHRLREEMVTVLLNRNWNRQMNLMVSLRMCSTKISTAKSRSQRGLGW